MAVAQTLRLHGTGDGQVTVRQQTTTDVVDEPGMSVVTIDPTTDPRWHQLTTAVRSDVFHSPGWLAALRDSYELEPRARVLIDEAGDPVAGLVFAEVDDMMDPRTISLPFSDFCDPLVSTTEQWEALTGDLIVPGGRFHTRCVHSEIPTTDSRLTQVNRARWHAVDLTRPSDDIWAEIHPSARRSIRKARKEGVEVKVGEGVDDVRAFFELHLRVRKYKYGLLAQPWSFFEHLWENMLSQGAGALMLAVHDGRPLGGVLFLEWGDTLYYKFNASDADHLSVRPNDLVIWNGIEHGQERGLNWLDFGLSDWDQEGLVRYKRKYATVEKTIHFLQQMPAGGPSEREAATRALLPRITDLMTSADVPDSVTEQAGGILYRYFT